MSARLRFVPWVRRGAAATVRTVDTLGPGGPDRGEMPVSLRVNDNVEVPVELRLHGPGDVAGFDTRTVLRSDPPDRGTDFDATCFPAIEFAVASLPWLLTPATGDAQGRLRPWLCLVVVRRQPGVTLEPRGKGLPILTVGPPARPSDELPDLAESWAWAHVQTVSADDSPLRDLLADEREGTLARLICPRRLEPGERYIACLVPAFESGRRSGLGLPRHGELAPAWRIEDDPASVSLPAYYDWEFGTGPAGDFESLARRLTGRPVPEGVGRLELDASAPGLDLPDGGVLSFEGALRVPGPDPADTVPEPFAEALTGLLNEPARARDEGSGDPVVAPPLYGSWQAVQQRLDADSPRWLREANLDPRLRAAAGLGTLVVQDQQENLMASAWEQLGSPGRDRSVLGRRDLARSVLAHVHATLAVVPSETFLLVTGPIHAKVRLEHPASVLTGSPVAGDEDPRTIRDQIRATQLPVSVVSGGFRKILRPRGSKVRGPRGLPVAPILPVLPILAPDRGRGPVVPAAVAATTVDAQAITERVRGLIVPSTQLAQAAAFGAAVSEATSYLADAVGGRPEKRLPGLAFDRFKSVVLDTISPASTLPPAVVRATGGRGDGRDVAAATGRPVAALPRPAVPAAHVRAPASARGRPASARARPHPAGHGDACSRPTRRSWSRSCSA